MTSSNNKSLFNH